VLLNNDLPRTVSLDEFAGIHGDLSALFPCLNGISALIFRRVQ
jgi:hypothetical protein